MKTIAQSHSIINIPAALDTARLAAVSVPVQAVGGLTVEQAMSTPKYGAPLVVPGAPLTIDANSFKTAWGNLEDKLRLVREKIHACGDIRVGKK